MSCSFILVGWMDIAIGEGLEQCFFFLYPLELNSKGMMKLNCDQLVLGG